MSVLARIFGSKQIIDGAVSAGDKLFFTKEEKAENWIKTIKAYEPFKLAQRLIALMVTGVYLFIWLLCALLIVVSIFVDGIKEPALELAKLNHETLSLPFALIVSFFFAGGTINSMKNRFKAKE